MTTLATNRMRKEISLLIVPGKWLQAAETCIHGMDILRFNFDMILLQETIEFRVAEFRILRLV